jgi:putative transposase
MENKDVLEPGYFYHIFNKGNNGENIFIEEINYDYFLALFDKHISPIAELYCFCLLKNHFHLLLRIKDQISDIEKSLPQSFSNFFNAYSKSINKKYNRTGSLFQSRFERKRITTDEYFRQAVMYIHLNPVYHEFTHDFLDYPFSSINNILKTKSTINKEIINWFGDKENFIYCHRSQLIKNLDFDIDLRGL